MNGVTSREMVRVGDGSESPRAGLPGLLATPVPRDELLARALASFPEEGIPTLLEVIAYHRLDGLAHRAVARLPQDKLDPWLRSSLRRRSQRLAAATLSQALALAEILDALDTAGIPVAVMRGLRTVETVYGDRSLRPFEDHDLLVLPEDRDLARALLGRLGYEERAWGLFRRGGIIVDLHVDPLGAHRRPSRQAVFPVDLRALFTRSTPGLVAGGPSLLFTAEDELLLLALHLVKHSFDPLIRLADVAHFVYQKRGSLDWDLLFHRARVCGGSRVLGWTLRALPLVGVAVRALDVPALEEEDGWLERCLMRRVLDARPLPYTGEALMTLSAPGLAARLRFLLDAFWPAGERPRGAWRTTAALPGRVVQLTRGAASQIAGRRRA
jgi:hypothetical protein